MGAEFVDWKEAGFSQGCINGGTGMPLAHDKSVALGPGGFCRAHTEHLGVEDSHDVCHRKDGSHVRAA